MAALAPSSPRLPSPPPPAEIQISPKSPSIGGRTASRQAQQMEQTAIDANSRRRIHPGTKAADFAAGPPLVPLNELDSAFQLQEHLAALHYYHTASNTQPLNRDTAKTLASPPPGIDRTLWLYELCRFLIAQCNSLIVGFLFDTPPCSAATCPEMRASEWQFLCAVHDTPKSCCAIDYCCHTLDWAANVVTNPKIFPSRFVLSDGAGHDKGHAVKNLVNVFRRLHRIFAHAWFQHRGVFWSVEGQTGLYVLFKTVCDLYDLLPAENYKLPPEAEGLETAPEEQQRRSSIVPTAIHTRPHRGGAEADDDHLQPVGRTNTRRHIRSSPSTGSAVTTVMEADEDVDSAGVANKMKEMHISAPETVQEEENEVAEVPVIVERGVMEAPEPPEKQHPAEAAAKKEDEVVAEPVTAAPPADITELHDEAESKPAEIEPERIQVESPDADTPIQGTVTGSEESNDADQTVLAPEADRKDQADLSETSAHDFAAEHGAEDSTKAKDREPKEPKADDEKSKEDTPSTAHQ